MAEVSTVPLPVLPWGIMIYLTFVPGSRLYTTRPQSFAIRSVGLLFIQWVATPSVVVTPAKMVRLSWVRLLTIVVLLPRKQSGKAVPETTQGLSLRSIIPGRRVMFVLISPSCMVKGMRSVLLSIMNRRSAL